MQRGTAAALGVPHGRSWRACRRWGDCPRSAQTPKHARFSAFHAKESLNYPISVNGTLIEWCAGLCGEALVRSGEIWCDLHGEISV